MDIEELNDLYTNAAENLRKVAALSLTQPNAGNVFEISQAKAQVYETVVNDLKALQAGKDN
jgi:hypothetical protein